MSRSLVLRMLSLHSFPIRPHLSCRKDIWETFPVSVMQLGRDANDKADRHAIVWNRKKIVAWRKDHPDTNAWFVYEKTVESLLLAELRRSTKWFVEPRQQDDQICVIRMAFRNGPRARSVRPNMENIPCLTRLTDVQTFFPMISYRETGNKTYSILFDTTGLQNPAQISFQLLKALKASTAWKILPAEDGELCRITFL